VKPLVEALAVMLGLLILGARFVAISLVTGLLPFAGLLAAALLSGAVRTVALVAVFPLMVMTYAAVRLADAAGHAVPAPRWPRPMEVTSR
jgi:hypothetical protein